jgi:o-succinylbenzoate synthase
VTLSFKRQLNFSFFHYETEESGFMEHVTIKKVTLHHVNMQLNNPFTTSFGTFKDKEFILVELLDHDGTIGWGESVAFNSPWYNEETVGTNQHIIEAFLIPLLRDRIEHPDELSDRFSGIRKNNMAKSAVEGAVWDLYAKKHRIPLYQALGGEKKEIDVGVSLGIKNTISELLEEIDQYVNLGYKRIKIKIKPGWDVDVIKQVRKHYPDLLIMADANSAYSLKDMNHLKKLDEFNLMMIEQPLSHDDIIDHSKLQAELKTPVCLDESIHSLDDAKKAIELGSCKIINIKIGRVGGLTEAKRIHDHCLEKGIPVWCGGMLESGVGRAHNIALSTLSNFILPGDTAGSSRYWQRDIINPEVNVENGEIITQSNPGIGYEVDRELLSTYTVKSKSYYL